MYLSGGEKQRISIARAVLKDAQVILLDEATASLDPENEVEMQKAIDTLIKGRTVITIAHKLKTIMNANRIIVLDDGQVKEQGTHDELIRVDGLYARLWKIQESTFWMEFMMEFYLINTIEKKNMNYYFSFNFS